MELKTALFHLPVLFSTWGWICLEGMRSRFSFIQLLVTLWTVACQAPLSMGFSNQEYWSESPCPPLGGLSNPGVKPVSVMSPALAPSFFTIHTIWEACLEGRVSFCLHKGTTACSMAQSTLGSMTPSTSDSTAKAYAAAAKSLQSCPTLCNPIDGSPPGFAIPGILQARTLEWVAISFSNTWKWKVKAKSLSRVWLFVTPWTAAHQAPPSMGFSRQEYWSRVPLTHCQRQAFTLTFSIPWIYTMEKEAASPLLHF